MLQCFAILPEKSEERHALLATTLAGFLSPFMGAAVNVALPAIADEFNLNAVALGWVATSYILAAAVFLVPFGSVADTHGRKRVFLWGIVVFTVGSVLSGAAFAVWLLVVARVLQGIGSAMTFGTATAILTSVFPPGERGRALGINVAAVYLGLSLGPALGGVMTRYLGWRSVFAAVVPLGIVVLLLTVLRVKGEWCEPRQGRFDVFGSAVYGAGLLLLMYGFSRLPGADGSAFTVLGILALAGFVLHERRTDCPVLDVSLFRRNRVFTFSNLAALVNYSAVSAVGFLMSLYLQYTRGFSLPRTGLVLVAAPIMQMLLSPAAGRLSDRVEPRIVASAGMAITGASLVLLCLVGSATPLPAIIISLALLGVGFGLFSSPNMNAIMSSVEKRDYGLAASMVATVRLVGQMLSMGIVMLLFALFLGREEIRSASHQTFLWSMRAAFIVFAGLCCVGVFASLTRGRLRPSDLPAKECR